MEHIEAPQGKEFLYFGYYISTEGEFVFKVGTTNDLNRRKAEHTKSYHNEKIASSPRLPKDKEFEYITYIPLSHANAERHEKRFIEWMIASELGEYIRNDRFILRTVPDALYYTIRNEYTIPLKDLI